MQRTIISLATTATSDLLEFQRKTLTGEQDARGRDKPVLASFIRQKRHLCALELRSRLGVAYSA